MTKVALFREKDGENEIDFRAVTLHNQAAGRRYHGLRMTGGGRICPAADMSYCTPKVP